MLGQGAIVEVHHKPKPFHNWREFLKEYGIIVLGVLTALGGEQAIETLHHRSEVQEVREALHEELGWNLASLKMQTNVSNCILTRLDEIEKWRKSWAEGRPLRLNRPINIPQYFVFRNSSWSVTVGDAAAHMPLGEREAYARLYDGLKNSIAELDRMTDAWFELRKYQQARSLSQSDLLDIDRNIDLLRGYAQVTGANYKGLSDEAGKMRIFPGKLPDAERRRKNMTDECQPLL
jgi:hypothetical protein